MVALNSTAAPTPQPGESESDFVVRAHNELVSSIPEPMERNQAVWDAWSAQHGNAERQRADLMFPADQYTKRSNICYFAEHEAASTGPDGKPIVRRYDAAKLSEIIGENNERIADVDAYPTIIDRHTVPAGVRDVSPPVTVGVSGPFRLGMIGRIKPRFAIFTDEYVRKDKESTIADRGGRSVEVVTLRANGRSYINPIAAISEAPRLPLPVQFSMADETEAFLDRYQMVAPTGASAPAFPGGGNTHVEKFDTDSPPSTQDQDPMNENELIRKIIDGIMGTEQMQWVSQQMQSSGTPAGGTDPSIDQPSQPPVSQPPAQQQQFGVPGAVAGGRYQADDNPETPGDEVTNEQYQALNDELQGMKDQYQAMHTSQQGLIEELASSKERIATLEVERADAVRTARLQELSSRYSTMNLDAEIERCLYSNGSSMDDSQFETHCDTIETYAASAIQNAERIPDGVMPRNPSSDTETARYQAQVSDLVRNLANECANRGEHRTYSELKAEAEQRLKG